MSAVWCVMLRMLDAIADFLSRGQWREDLIDEWKEAFQVLEATDSGSLHPLSECHWYLGMNTRWALARLGMNLLHICQCVPCSGHSHVVDGPGMTAGER